MKILAHIGVKDEVELIGRTLRHLEEIGVESFIVCDLGSTDGTRDALAARKSGSFRVLDIPDNEPAELWYEANLAAVREADADWVVFLDADELLLARSGRLEDVLQETSAECLTIRRYNVPLSPEGPLLPRELAPASLRDVELIAEPIPDFAQHLMENPDVPWVRAIPAPKTIARRDRIGRLTAGMHRLFSLDGKPFETRIADDLVIAHLPFTTEERFAKKVENIAAYLERHGGQFGSNQAWHWRRWVALARAGELHREFERSVFSVPLIEELRTAGVIKTAAELLGLSESPLPVRS